MSLPVSIALVVVGLGLVVYFAEKLVEGVVGTSLGFGLSAFLVSVVFLGFDPENLAVGSVASFEEVPGIALGCRGGRERCWWRRMCSFSWVAIYSRSPIQSPDGCSIW